MGRIVVTGGCGYIGSHTIVDLIENGFEVLSIDNNSKSTETPLEGIEKITGKSVKNYQIDLTDFDATLDVFSRYDDIVGVIHFAAYKSVPESVGEPLEYYKNNLGSLLNILKACKKFNIKNIVFSSSCSVYGNTTDLPVSEKTPLGITESPYATTKHMGETICKDFSKVADCQLILLRYFNPVGAHPSAQIGETPIGVPNNLVPFITQTAIGIRKELTVFGGDYDTRDGSCIRDYIHVMDIANAHTKALQYLIDGKQKIPCEVFNLGTGNGVTVLEAVKAFEKVSGTPLNYKMGERRAGDVVAVYADNCKAKEALGWEIKHDIYYMMKTAWAWEKEMQRRNE